MQLAIERLPDLIFLALRLPGIMDAVRVLEQLRQDVRTQHVPVAILSSETDFELVKDRLNHGALDHVVTEHAEGSRAPHATVISFR
jgi:CheY-like chemotaxis protein